MTAPKLDFLLEILDNRNNNPESYDTKVKEKINELYDLLDKIKPLSDDEYKVLYFSVEKGNIEEYGNYEELKVDGEVDSYEEFKTRFNEDYADEIMWYKMTSTKYKNYRMISINSKTIIYADMNNENTNFEDYQLQELLDFLIIKVKDCIQKLEDETYNDYISNNYSYKNRFGVIKRNVYWNIYPDTKKKLLNEISQEEMNYFIENASDKTNNRIKNMTSRKYFECVGLVYENIGYEISNLTDKELYLKYADGRDEGLSKIDENSSQEFDKWYNDYSKFGGHPWEIIRGHSFTRVNLQVHNDDNGYYLSLDGNIILRKIEIAKIFIALNKNNIPVQIYNVNIIKNAFKGIDYIGIVPNDIMPIECGGYFKKYKPTEFIHMEDNKIFKYIEWELLENIELK
ncbi:MAG: hypothetical protein IJ068_04640 [Bacilli bacterium]|nr:hypothetical protein [Bacilli bacterium]